MFSWLSHVFQYKNYNFRARNFGNNDLLTKTVEVNCSQKFLILQYIKKYASDWSYISELHFAPIWSCYDLDNWTMVKLLEALGILQKS